MRQRLPDWTTPKNFDREAYERMRRSLERSRLNTVCIEADCPNRYECFSKGTATFMILGNVCTRNCTYCDVRHGKAETVDATEPGRIAEAVKELRIKHAVITCVTRDDLSDGGADHLAKVVRVLRKGGKCTVELLISDLNGNEDALKTIAGSKPDVLGHNIETVRRLFPKLRPNGSYERSLSLLNNAKSMGCVTKSGLMVGLGETMDEALQTLKDLRKAKCDIVTVGQYLQPKSRSARVPVKKYYSPPEFKRMKEEAMRLRFRRVEAGPLVRSSYHARAL